jgi:hypothetical protein
MRPFTASRMITVRLPSRVLPGGISGSAVPVRFGRIGRIPQLAAVPERDEIVYIRPDVTRATVVQTFRVQTSAPYRRGVVVPPVGVKAGLGRKKTGAVLADRPGYRVLTCSGLPFSEKSLSSQKVITGLRK